MFSKDDLVIDDPMVFLEHLPIFVFCGLVAPFVIAAYTVGFVMDKLSLLRGPGPAAIWNL